MLFQEKTKTEHKQNIDTILSYILVKKLVTPIVNTKAYKLGLVNNAGKVIKEPKSEKEKDALTLLDKIVFKLKRLLGTRLLNLRNFLYLQVINNDFYSKLIVKGSIKQRAEILRIVKDVKNMRERYNIDTESLICVLLEEQFFNESGKQILKEYEE